MHDYRAMADIVAAEIAAGTMPPGSRMPPQRSFAYDRGIAVSTAARVYAELTRRGLVSGEVGRGTFVRAKPSGNRSRYDNSGATRINLEHVFPILPDQARRLGPAFARLATPAALAQALLPIGVAGTADARRLVGNVMAQGGWAPDPSCILFSGSGRQGIAAALATLAVAGDRVGVECLSYPGVKSVAARLGIVPVPIAMDDEGIVPDSIDKLHRDHGIKAIYLQTALQNPLGMTMGASRRESVARSIASNGLIAIEDRVYAFLTDDPPLAAIVPDRVILIDSLSKRLAPGTNLGFLVAPERWIDRVRIAVHTGGWGPHGMPMAVAMQWIAEGIVADVALAKRDDARLRQAIATETLAGSTIRRDTRSYHLWLELPDPWRADTFSVAAARLGIAIAPAGAFAVMPGHVPNAVRLALAAPPLDVLERALSTLARLVASEDDVPTE
ncbi:MAG: PLP-dependent aminotransferase family protein [Rhodospirillales bacterium]